MVVIVGYVVLLVSVSSLVCSEPTKPRPTLVRSGAIPEVLNNFRNVLTRSQSMIDLMQEEELGVDADPLSSAADENNIPKAQALLDSRASVDGFYKSGAPLFNARTGPMAGLLLKYGASLQMRTTVEMLDKIEGETVVGWATRPGQSPGYLLECLKAGADVNAVDKRGMPPLARLMQRAQQHLGCVLFAQKAEYLMRYGARLDAMIRGAEGESSITCVQYLSNQLTQKYENRHVRTTRIPGELTTWACLRTLQKTLAQEYSLRCKALYESLDNYLPVAQRAQVQQRPLIELVIGYDDDLISYDEDETQDSFYKKPGSLLERKVRQPTLRLTLPIKGLKSSRW